MKLLNRREVLAGFAGTSIFSMAGFHPAFADDGYIELTARETKIKLKGLAGPDSELMGYDGLVPGPTLRFTRGQMVRIRFRNELDVPTTVHWHGIRLDNAMDGVPGLTQDAIPPGGSFDYEFTPPDAGTFWYHAHVDSWSQVARGLFGALIIDEVTPAFAPENDHVLVLTDWRVDDAGAFDVASMGGMHEFEGGGRIGNLLTVNGVEKPEIPVSSSSAQRLRLINTSTARILKLELTDAKVAIIARDGQPLASPKEVSGDILLGPAQRVDLTAEFAPDVPAELNEFGGIVMARFIPSGPATAQASPVLVPADLPVPDLATIRWIPLLMEGGVSGRLKDPEIAQLHGGMAMKATAPPLWAFNNVVGMGDKPLFEAAGGESIGIEMTNKTEQYHAIHIHGHDFRIIRQTGPANTTWFDTVVIAPAEVMRIAFVAGKPGKWMIHCHVLEHSVAGMDTWFRVS
ncbi:multicopper oxidase family protein [Mesorhizobium sophorae]|uniref:multicopper oxidase family protein n=1 Tax=Mesorhizobium sophorae TaxID=1300294 RepID=UPI00142E8DB4|nr:multicopper oxidase family protein [Mesorhizobium sophorae]